MLVNSATCRPDDTFLGTTAPGASCFSGRVTVEPIINWPCFYKACPHADSFGWAQVAVPQSTEILRSLFYIAAVMCLGDLLMVAALEPHIKLPFKVPGFANETYKNVVPSMP